MTNQDAIHLLRTEQIGDSEAMELAKQMGAKALECLQSHFISPRCENCGNYITGVEIRYEWGHKNCLMMSVIDPSVCPYCGTNFYRVDIDYENETCILREGQDNEQT